MAAERRTTMLAPTRIWAIGCFPLQGSLSADIIKYQTALSVLTWNKNVCFNADIYALFQFRNIPLIHFTRILLKTVKLYRRAPGHLNKLEKLSLPIIPVISE